MTKRRTLKEFIEKANVAHNKKYDYSKVDYINNSTKVCIICPEHGEFWQRPDKHLNLRHGCPYCSPNLKGTNKSFIERAKKIHGDKYDYSKIKYVNNHTNVCIICPEHGEFWQTPHNHLQGKGCMECGKPLMRSAVLTSMSKFIAKSKKHHGNKYDYSKVDLNNRDENGNVCIICPTHGEFWQKPFLHMNGFGCKKCSASHLENEIMLFLKENNIKYIHQCNKHIFPWLGKMSLDFYLPSYKIAIECQGVQHFKPVDFAGYGEEWAKNNFLKIINNDTKKNYLCGKNNIKLIYFSNFEHENVINDKKILLEIINEQKVIL